MDIKNELVEILKKRNNYNEKLSGLLTNIKSIIVDLPRWSNGEYQIEKNIRLNKVSLKDYILNSPVCKDLEDNNISNYSIDELKMYMDKYAKKHELNKAYKSALQLYEYLEEFEKWETMLIVFETKELKKIIPDIELFKDAKDGEFKEIFDRIYSSLEKYNLEYELFKETIDSVKNVLFYYREGHICNIFEN